MEIKEIVNSFVKKQIETQNNIVAAIFYGSHCYHTADENSDIDLLFLTRDGSSFRGRTNYEGKIVEYKMLPLWKLEQECMTSIQKQETFLWSVFQNGEVIFNLEKTVERYSKYFRFRHRSKLPTYEVDKIEKAKLLTNWNTLCQSESTNFFWTIYFNLLNQIRIDYQKMKGYSRIPISKVHQFYQNREYAEKYYCAVLPEQNFTNAFVESIENTNVETARNSLMNYAKLFTIEFPEITKIRASYPVRRENLYQTPNMSNLKETAAQLINKYEKTIFALLQNKPEKDYLYYIVLEQLRRFYEIQCGVLNNSPSNAIMNYSSSLNGIGMPKLDPDFMKYYLESLMVKETTEKIAALEKIFSYALKDIPMNTQEYLIKLQK